MNEERLLLKVAEAAKLLSVSRAHLYRLRQRGKIRFVKIGRATRVSLGEVLRLANMEERGHENTDSD